MPPSLARGAVGPSFKRKFNGTQSVNCIWPAILLSFTVISLASTGASGYGGSRFLMEEKAIVSSGDRHIDAINGFGNGL
jgi:hypothetical protein